MENNNLVKELTQQHINSIKQSGYRPCVVAAIVCNGTIGMMHSNKYPGYEFVQGGIEFGENPLDTIEREMVEELGYSFYAGCIFPPKKFKFLFETKMEMKVKSMVLTEDGKEIKPSGKHYLVCALDLDSKDKRLPDINPEDYLFNGSTVKFHSCQWVGAKKARDLAKKISNTTKRELTIKAISMLQEDGWIS